ncbi:hemolysin family protein [Corynebacterium hansenii]|uniref:Hemolysin family protein n=1 Tax=Corynebacterium hansenii TaxID=394964 RepID=A0ABV7ZP88_9CORY|nr:hemolysin family protein [Corynebacterium hansenii]WJZ00570.1 Hemolysin C [Corynebacterium hansenii]
MSIFASFAWVMAFILVGGTFAATEMALVSLRESQISQLSRGRGAGKKVAALAKDSGRFLSAVQIGVTFAGFLSSAFGASAIAPQIAPVLERWGMPDGLAAGVSLVAMTVLVSYLSLVFGELVPKRIAMQKAKRVAVIVAPPLDLFAKLMTPVIWVIDTSSSLILRGLGFDPKMRTSAMTTEEIREIVSSHKGFGLGERELVTEVFEAGAHTLAELMRHRSEMQAFSADRTIGDVLPDVVEGPYSRYPIYRGTVDQMIGFFHVRDLLEAVVSGRAEEPIPSICRDIPHLPSSLGLPAALRRMRQSGQHIAIVVDEYGGTDGMVTLEDLIEELVGEIWDEYDDEERRTYLGLHESRILDGATNLQDFAARTGIHLPEGPYETVAGWMLARLGRLGRAGDVVEIPHECTEDVEDDDIAGGVFYRLEAVGVEGTRIVSVRLSKSAIKGSGE